MTWWTESARRRDFYARRIGNLFFILCSGNGTVGGQKSFDPVEIVDRLKPQHRLRGNQRTPLGPILNFLYKNEKMVRFPVKETAANYVLIDAVLQRVEL